MKFGNFISIQPGLNSRELKKQQAESYTIADFNYDLTHSYEYSKMSINDSLSEAALQQGDLIIKLHDFNLAIVSSENAGKVYAQRFLKIVPKNTDIVDLNYLLFVFNGSKLIQKQVHNILEGNLIKTIKLRDVLNLNLKLPPIEAQKKIGNYYQSLKEYEILTQEKLNLLDKMSMSMLNDLNEMQRKRV